MLLPVARNDAAGAPRPLNWGEYRGELMVARFGLREPPEPWLPADGDRRGGDGRGPRPGRRPRRYPARPGRGLLRPSLVLADPTARLIAMVRDDEVVDHLPGESHDVLMTHALTPGRGLVRLGRH